MSVSKKPIKKNTNPMMNRQELEAWVQDVLQWPRSRAQRTRTVDLQRLHGEHVTPKTPIEDDAVSLSSGSSLGPTMSYMGSVSSAGRSAAMEAAQSLNGDVVQHLSQFIALKTRIREKRALMASGLGAEESQVVASSIQVDEDLLSEALHQLSCSLPLIRQGIEKRERLLQLVDNVDHSVIRDTVHKYRVLLQTVQDHVSSFDGARESCNGVEKNTSSSDEAIDGHVV